MVTTLPQVERPVVVAEPPTTAAAAASVFPVLTVPVAAPAPTTPATAPSLPNPVERAVAHQVSRALNRLPGGGDKSLVIRLTPPELGTVQVELREREGGLVVILRAEDPAVQKALERLVPQLRSDLQQGDRSVVSVQTDDRNGGAPQRDPDGRGGAAMQQHQQRHSGDQSGRRGSAGRERSVFSLGGVAAAPAITLPATPVRARSIPAGGVDLLA